MTARFGAECCLDVVHSCQREAEPPIAAKRAESKRGEHSMHVTNCFKGDCRTCRSSCACMSGVSPSLHTCCTIATIFMATTFMAMLCRVHVHASHDRHIYKFVHVKQLLKQLLAISTYACNARTDFLYICTCIELYKVASRVRCSVASGKAHEHW